MKRLIDHLPPRERGRAPPGYKVNPLEHAGLAYAEARRFWARGNDREDLEQAALVGLCKAARRYDSSKGTFATYAGRMIRYEILALLANSRRLGRWGGCHLNSRVIFRLARLLRHGEVTIEAAREVLNSPGLTDAEVGEALVYAAQVDCSLDAPWGSSGVGGYLGHEIVPAPDQEFDQSLRERDWKRMLADARSYLAARGDSAAAVYDRFVLDEEELERACEEGRINIGTVGRDMGFTRQNAHVQLKKIRAAVLKAGENLGLLHAPEGP